MEARMYWAIREKGEYVKMAEWKSKGSQRGKELWNKLREGEVRLCIEREEQVIRVVVAKSGSGIYSLLEVLGNCVSEAVRGGTDYLFPEEVVTEKGGRILLNPGIEGYWEYHERFCEGGILVGYKDGKRVEAGAWEARKAGGKMVEEVLGEVQGIPDDDIVWLKKIVDHFG